MKTSERINKILIDQHLKPAELAEKTGISVRTLQRYIKGETERIQVENANKINKKFPEYDSEWIMGNVKNDENEENSEDTKEPSVDYKADRFEDIVAHKVIQRQKKDMDYLKERISELNEKLNQLLVEREVILEQELSSKKKLTDS